MSSITAKEPDQKKPRSGGEEYGGEGQGRGVYEEVNEGGGGGDGDDNEHGQIDQGEGHDQPWGNSRSSSTARSEASSSPSSRGTAWHGHAVIDQRLRSATHHQAGPPLLCFLNHGPGQPCSQPCCRCVDEFAPNSKPAIDQARASPRYDEVFRDAFLAFAGYTKAWHERTNFHKLTPEEKLNKKEPPKPTLPYAEINGTTEAPKPTEEILASAMHERLESALRSAEEGDRVQSCHQLPLEYDGDRRERPCHTNLLLRQKANDSVPKPLLLLLQVGITNDWWKKADQNLDYVLAFLENQYQNEKTTFKEAMLFAVLTIETARGGEAASFRAARFGVFLCTRAKHPSKASGNDGFRMSLLWRQRGTRLRDISRGLGKTLRAACLLPGLLAERKDHERVRYLGPSCCRVGDWVYRAYDTRFRHTQRRPDLYASFAPPKPGGVDGARPCVAVVCRVSAGRMGTSSDAKDIELRDSRARAVEKFTRQEWMWQVDGAGHLLGELVVIKIPYVEGRHFASCPADFMAVVQFLHEMHVAGFVHGDIRGFNMIAGKRLIDLDYGGSIQSEPRYPEGYVRSLDDGYRLGLGGKRITLWHDWFAMLWLIFEVHEVKPPRGTSMDDSDDFRSLLHGGEPPDDELKRLSGRLIRFLEESEGAGWTVMAKRNFRDALDKHSKAAVPVSEPGTPSPPGKKTLFNLLKQS